MSLWLQHGSKLSNTRQKTMTLIALAALSYAHGSNLLYSTHYRLGQLILLARINWMGKGILTKFKIIQFNSIQLRSIQLIWYFKHIH